MKKKIKDLLRKPITNLIIGGIISWSITWFLPSKPVVVSNLLKKDLACTLNFSQNLIEKRTNDNRLQILYDGEQIETPYIFNITIKNVGEYEISNEDFKDDFIIKFEGCNRIVNAQVTNTTNKEIYDEILLNARYEKTDFILTNFFLNPNEEFTLNIITDGAPNDVSYNYRISGISELTLINAPKERRDNIRNRFLILVILALVILILFFIYSIYLNKKLKKLYKDLEEYLEEQENEQ